TATGEILGTLEYIAPEQADARAVDGRADLYGLGATLFALLCGRPPFQGTGIELLKKHLIDPPPSPRAIAPGVPPRLDALVLRLLAKRPEDRPATALDVAWELDAIARGEGGGATWRRSAVAIALVVAVLVAIVAFLVRRPSSEPAPIAAPK